MGTPTTLTPVAPSTTTSLPVTSTVTAPASSTTALDPVTVAINKLSKTAIANLWEEKVINAPWYTKLSGLISYAWNRSTAVAADKQFGTTIVELNNASKQLVKAIASRSLVPQEAAALGLPSLRFNDPASQMAYAQSNLNAESKLKTFYDVFKTRISQLNINENSNDFGVYATAAQKVIKDLSQSKEVLSNLANPATLPTKIKSTLQGFNAKIFEDMIGAFASQPITDITIDSFKQKAALIKGFFPAIDNVDIETRMRQAIKAKHDTADFDRIRGEYTSPDANAPRLVAAKTAIQSKLEAERNSLQAELDVLRGTEGDNGTVNTAFEERIAAATAMNTAKTAYVTHRGAFGSAASATTPVSELIALVDTDPRIIQLKEDLVQKAQAFEAKKQAHENLVARFDEVAQYNPGTTNRIGGKLFQVEAGLDPLAIEAAARAETAKNANFYNELNIVVGDTTKVVRSQALHRIID